MPEPTEAELKEEQQAFDRFVETAASYWSDAIVPPGDTTRTIVVELMIEDVRVALRNLTVANAIRRTTPARLVVVIGADQDWLSRVWTFYDPANMTKLARAFRADDVVDVHDIVDRRTAGEHADVVVGGRGLGPSPHPPIDEETLAANIYATACRSLGVPRITEEIRGSERFGQFEVRSREFSRVYDELIHGVDAIGVVSSHVDYNHWGLVIESARRFDVPAIHIQSTGNLKAYSLFWAGEESHETFRSIMTRHIADVFEREVWPRREMLRYSAELAASRAKRDLARPSWWRGGSVSTLDIADEAERAYLRGLAAAKLGWDPERRVVGVYNHAVSDALNTNLEAFDDLAGWFEATVDHAAGHPEVNWLFVDHPQQKLYDTTSFFETLADKYADVPHLRFIRSMDLSKNFTLSLVDLGITVRGSISNELPAFGIPAIQAGWSEWSQLGFTTVCDTPEQYWETLDRTVTRLAAGERLIDAEQVERARLWLWFYRSGADVPGPLVPYWELGRRADLFTHLRNTYRWMHPDGDQQLASVRRMWLRREPVLTRLDLRLPDDVLAMQLAPVDTAVEPPDATGRVTLRTAFDTDVQRLEVPGEILSGEDERMALVDGIYRGVAIVGRIHAATAFIGIRVDDLTTDAVVELVLAHDGLSDEWWENARLDGEGDRAPIRFVSTSIQGGEPQSLFAVRSRMTFRSVVRAADVTAGLIYLEVTSPPVPDWAEGVFATSGAVGLSIHSITVGPVTADLPASTPPGPTKVVHDKAGVILDPATPLRLKVVCSPWVVASRRVAATVSGIEKDVLATLDARHPITGEPVDVTSGIRVGRRRATIEVRSAEPAVVRLDQLPQRPWVSWQKPT